MSVSTKINFIFGVTNDCLRNIYKPYEYKNVIIPFVIAKRFNDCGYNNKSGITFNNLTTENIIDYLNGFNDEVQDIFEKFDFFTNVNKLNKNNVLELLIEKFNKSEAYFGLDEIDTTSMGYLFENLIKEFANKYEETGEHFTSDDIVSLLTDILLIDGCDKDSITVYDQTMGTSQMLRSFEKRAKELNKDIKVECYGQEINKETFAIAKTDFLLSDKNVNNLYCGNTLIDDGFKDMKFDFILSNPPFGVDWKSSKKEVIKDDRFKVGTPRTSDGQMLFILNGLSKLKDDGRMAIIHSGSVLFSGDAGSGESEIRRYLIENDYLETVIQLPKDLFYNTSINTYVLIITKNKSEDRKGEIQLIDASKCFSKMRKPIGKKHVKLNDEAKELIIKCYEEERYLKHQEKNGDMIAKSKWFKNEEFGFYKITTERPKRDEEDNILYDKKGKMVPDAELRDTETVPLTETIEEYMAREVLPYASDAWIDETKTKIGYEIPFTRYFYEYVPPRPSQDILAEIIASEERMMATLKELLGNE